MVKRNGKQLGEYNSHDVRKEFTWLYSRRHYKDYIDRGFIGYDLKIIKQAIEKYGLFKVLSGIYNGIHKNSDSVSIKYIIKGFEFNYYLTAYNPEVYYKVMAYGNSRVKAYWRKYVLLDTRWLPSAASEQRKNKIETQLLEWANAKKD